MHAGSSAFAASGGAPPGVELPPTEGTDEIEETMKPA